MRADGSEAEAGEEGEVRAQGPQVTLGYLDTALDAEWRMKKGEIPGKTYGSATAAEINGVTEYVQGLVQKNNLPEKLVLIHQVRLDMLPDRTTELVIACAF